MLWDAIGTIRSVNSTDTAETMLGNAGVKRVRRQHVNSLQQCKLPAAQPDAKSFLQIEQLQSSASVLV